MLSPGKYYHDTLLRIEIAFTDENDAAIDPDTVVFKARSRFGTCFTFTYGTDDELTKLATGNYAADLTPDTPGRWTYRWETTGTGTTLRTEGNFLVQDSPFFSWPSALGGGWGCGWWY